MPAPGIFFGNGADKVTTVAKGGQVKFVDGENTTATVTKDAEGKATVIFDLKNTISLGKDGAEGHIGLNGKDGLTDIRTGSGVAGVNGKVGEKATRILYKDPKGAEQQVATLADGLRFKGDSGEAAKSLNSVMTIKGADANISTAVNDGGDMLISLGKNLKVDSLAAGGTVIGKEGISVKGSDGNAVAITKNGIDAGGKAISNVGRGVNADDAVTKAQLDEVANHAGANLLPAVHELGSRVNRVGAGAAALAALHPQNFDPDDKWDFSAGYGNYRGANALAVGAFYRPNGTTMISVGGSFGGGENMLNAGVSLKFGSHNPYAGYSGAALHGVIADQDRQIAELKQVVASQREEMQTMKAQMQTILQRLDTLKN